MPATDDRPAVDTLMLVCGALSAHLEGEKVWPATGFDVDFIVQRRGVAARVTDVRWT